jgi:hypothetical protein
MPFRAMRNGFFVKSPANQELFVMTPALLLLVILSDQALGRDLSLVFSLLAVADWALNGYGLRGHAPWGQPAGTGGAGGWHCCRV